MDIKEFINKVCQEIKYEPVKKGISEELTSHIQDIKEEYINKGIQEKEAEEKAVSQMGIAEDINFDYCFNGIWNICINNKTRNNR